MTDLRQAAVQMLEASAREFQERAGRIGADLWDRVPGSGGWSPAQLAEHLALVEASCARVLPRKLFGAPAAEEILLVTRTREAGLAGWWETETKRVAPDFVAPARTWPDAEGTLAAFDAHRTANIETYRQAPTDLRAYAMPHPILGPLDGYQWAVFLSEHLRRHLRQLDQILQDLGVTALSEGRAAHT